MSVLVLGLLITRVQSVHNNTILVSELGGSVARVCLYNI